MSARILIVDDNVLNVKLLAAKLAKDYYFVSTAFSGPEALEIVSREIPDIVLLDIMMPGMDGFEVCEKIRSDPATRHIPVVMITALSDIKDRVRGLEAGANDFLIKPINDTALFARVRSLLRLKMMTDEWRLREAALASFAVIEEDTGRERALVLEDRKMECAHVEKALASMGCETVVVSSVAEAFEKTAGGEFALVVVSLDLVGQDALYLCAQLRAREATRTLPILMLADENRIDAVARGLDLGASDYLLRPLEAAEVVARTRTQLQQKKHYDRLRKKFEQSISLALVDPLTNAYNRRYLDTHLPMLFSRSNATHRPLSVISIDLDHFKKVNDTYGHAAGDAVLQETVNRVQMHLRASDLVVRMGGEEFAVVMPDTETKTALSVAERLRASLVERPYILPENKGEIPISGSFGVSSLRDESDDTPAKILARADAALYRAKETGRNKVVSEES